MSTSPNAKTPRIPELVGATETQFQLKEAVTEVAFRIEEPSGPASLSAEDLADWMPRRVFLNLEKIIGEHGGPPFYLYFNVPAEDRAERHPELFAGDLSLFGLLEASISDEWHVPNGLYSQIEVTNLWARLTLMDNWDRRNLRVRFVSKYPGKFPPIQIGRMSLYFA